MSFRSFIEQNVRDAWAPHERPGAGTVWVSIPVPPEMTMDDIPFLPECSRIEIERVGEDGPIRLIYRKDTGAQLPCPRCTRTAEVGVNKRGPLEGQKALSCVYCGYQAPC